MRASSSSLSGYSPRRQGGVASNIITSTFRQQYCPPELLGRITASVSVVNYGTIPLGGVVGGGLAAAFGVRNTLWLMTGLAAASVLVLLGSRLRTLRDFPVLVPTILLPEAKDSARGI